MAEHVRECVSECGCATVALAGGSTPRRLYEMLASEEFSGRVDWQRVHLYWGDERCVSPDHKQSNYRMAYESLIRHVPVPETQVYRIPGELPPEEAAARYETLLKQHLPPHDGVPRLDAVILGVGEDGHTASLFPGSSALAETGRMAVAVTDREPARVSLALQVLNVARHVLFLVAGASKAPVVRHILYEGNARGYPAGLVQQENATWLLGGMG